jgi:type II secretory pathway predicted ATPase ExeA
MGAKIMFHRALTADFSALSIDSDSLLQRLTPCDRAALSKLTRAFDECRPITFLIGAGRARSSQVIDKFLATTDEQTSVVRISGPCTDATSCMREVIRSIGFEPKDFGLTDLENIFKMFLAFQKDHGSRTVICIEETQDCSSWALEKVFELAKLEMAETFGLFIILSGRRKLARVLNQHTPHAEAVLTGRHIRVATLTQSETREFVIQQAKSEGFDDASQIIELEAITQLYEISDGVPDTLYGLCNRSLQSAAEDDAYPITANVVERSAAVLGLIPDTLSETVEQKGSVDQGVKNFGRFVLRLGGRKHGDRAIDSDCISIGRDSLNDLCIPSLLVSRHHVLIARGSAGVRLADLGSTNGTTVNGEQVISKVLKDGDKIMLGDCQIEYAAADPVMDAIVSAEILSSGKPIGRAVEMRSRRNPGQPQVHAVDGKTH